MMTATHNVDYNAIKYTLRSNDTIELHDDYFGLSADMSIDDDERNARCEELAAFIALEFECDIDDVDVLDAYTIELH